jgi:hypothetical protein
MPKQLQAAPIESGIALERHESCHVSETAFGTAVQMTKQIRSADFNREKLRL